MKERIINYIKDGSTLELVLAILFIMIIGAYFGVTYADNEWKSNLNEFAVNHTEFTFSGSEKIYYTIQKHDSMFFNVSEIDVKNITNITIIEPNK